MINGLTREMGYISKIWVLEVPLSFGVRRAEPQNSLSVIDHRDLATTVEYGDHKYEHFWGAVAPPPAFGVALTL